jgi:hypothetical protein
VVVFCERNSDGKTTLLAGDQVEITGSWRGAPGGPWSGRAAARFGVKRGADPVSDGRTAKKSTILLAFCWRLGEQYRRIARRRGKQKAIVAVSRVICEIACILISDPGARFTDLGAGYYNRGDSRRQTRSRIRELERLNPGMKVTLTPVQQAA